MLSRKVVRRVALCEAALLAFIICMGLLLPEPPFVIPAAKVFDAAQAGTVQRDVTYCAAGGLALKMDIFYPQVIDSSPAPVAMYVHGGGWSTGSKDWLGRIIDPALLTSKGYLVASIDYRLAPQYKWPAQIQDAQCAVRYLRANAQAYHIDPGRIGVFGESAGGHLSALLGLAGSAAGYDPSGDYLDQSSRVQAVVDMCGPTDFTTFDVNSYTSGMASLLLGVRGVKSTLMAASPVNYVDNDAPPFLIFQGDKDPLVPADQSQELYDKLAAAGDDASLVIVKNAGHVFQPIGGTPSPSMSEIRSMMIDFFDRKLRQEPLTTRYFPQTGKIARSGLLTYWNNHGGLSQLGYPITEELMETSQADGKSYTVQYFERAVLERHPENSPPYDVQLSLLGSFRYNTLYPAGAPGQVPNSTAGSVLFSQTGHRLGGVFLDYWRAHGGLAQQGYPISDEFTEVSGLDGKPYTVQYFERAVFEYHPENPPDNRVLLSQLGTLRYRAEHGK